MNAANEDIQITAGWDILLIRLVSKPSSQGARPATHKQSCSSKSLPLQQNAICKICQHNFNIFPSRGGRFNEVWMSMTNIRAPLKVGEGWRRYVWNDILIFATVHLGCLFSSASFEAFSHSKDLDANWRLHAPGGLWGKLF